MTYKKILSGVTLSLVAILTIAAITGYGINDIIAEESTEEKYKTVNDVNVIGEFQYGNHKGTELVEFQVFTQTSGFDVVNDAVQFTLVKELNDKSPFLYEMADLASKHSNMARNASFEFDVNILLAQDDQILRAFSYASCIVNDYKVETLYDKEEGWMGKGFATIDEFTIRCGGYNPENPVYDKFMAPTPTSDQISSIDLIDGRNPAFG